MKSNKMNKNVNFPDILNRVLTLINMDIYRELGR